MKRGVRYLAFAVSFFLGVLTAPFAEATFVTMAQFDINGDGEEEIIRTEGVAGETTIKIYEPLPKSYFFKPVKELKITGNLVQVPDVFDVTGDQLPDFYFATGSDIGVIFYDTIEDEYKRQNEIEGQPVLPSPSVAAANKGRLLLEKAESDLYMGIERRDEVQDNNLVSYKGSPKG